MIMITGCVVAGVLVVIGFWWDSREQIRKEPPA